MKLITSTGPPVAVQSVQSSAHCSVQTDIIKVNGMVTKQPMVRPLDRPLGVVFVGLREAESYSSSIHASDREYNVSTSCAL